MLAFSANNYRADRGCVKDTPKLCAYFGTIRFQEQYYTESLNKLETDNYISTLKGKIYLSTCKHYLHISFHTHLQE